MLNELLVVERGARQAGLEMLQRHPDVKDARQLPTLVVKVAASGKIDSVEVLPPNISPWTLRDGQHNSFPFLQLKWPIWKLANQDERRNKAVDKKYASRRDSLLSIAQSPLPPVNSDDWPGMGLINRLIERRSSLAALELTDAALVVHTIDRFLLACDSRRSGDTTKFLESVARLLIVNLRRSANMDWLEVACALLLGQLNKNEERWESTGAILVEASDSKQSIYDAYIATRVSEVLRGSEAQDKTAGSIGTCCLTGDRATLVSGNFPQPNLPVLGQTYLFAKNRDIPASGRYGRYSADAISVGQDTVIGLSAAVEALTSDDRRGITWSPLAGEVPKQTDLLLSYVEPVPGAQLARHFTQDDGDNDLADGLGEERSPANSIAAYEKRTERLIEAIKAKVGADFRQTPVRLIILRKVDPANRKVLYSNAPSVGALYDAAIEWTAGERNSPEWLAIPVFSGVERKPRRTSPPHVAPLAIVNFSKQIFLKSGKRPDGNRKERIGMPACEALALYLERTSKHGDFASKRVYRMLSLVLSWRRHLVANTAHALRKGIDAVKDFDRREALRTVSVICILLYKLERGKVIYMNDIPFKLGQLLAAADVVHAGYCADVRGGDLPPALLGNQVLATAQSNPVKALAVLGRRWKPYDGWARRAARNVEFTDSLANSKKPDEKRRGWDIRKAVRHAREMKAIADDLAQRLPSCKVDDVFRAELLLGYIAGFPPAQEPNGQDVE